MGYLKRLQEMDWLRTPHDIVERGGMNKGEIDALNKFLNYYEKALFLKDFNGYTKETFISAAKRHRTGTGVRAGQKTDDLTPGEVMAVLEKLPNDDVKAFYLVAAYSGARSEQLYEMFELVGKGSPLKIDQFDGFFRVDVRELSKNTKKALYYYFPADMIAVLKNYRNVRSHSAIKEEIQEIGRGDRPVNVSSLRKFNANQLRLAGIDPDVAEAMQGRAPAGVGAKHYLNLGGVQALAQYPKALSLLSEGLPVPEWMEHYESIGEKPKRPAPPKNTITEAKRKEILKLHKEGVSQREIAKHAGVARDTVSKVIKAT